MKLIIFVAVLLLASGAWWQQKKPKLSTYHVEIVWQGKPLCCITVQEPEHRILGVDTARSFALQDATNATVWTDAEWKACDPCLHPEKYGLPKDLWKASALTAAETLVPPCNSAKKGEPCILVAPPTKLSKWDAAVPPCDSENLLPCWEKDGSLRVSEERDFDWSPFTSEDDPGTSPFDVSPKESYMWEPPLPNPLKDDGWQAGCVTTGPVMGDLVNWACINGVLHHRVHRRVCADKKRVLLMSEDKKWHCYDFGRLGHLLRITFRQAPGATANSIGKH